MMRDRIKSIVSGMALNKGAELESIRKTEKELNFVFPDYFKKFLLFSNGAAGEIDGDYLELWGGEQVLVSNRFIEINKYAPGASRIRRGRRMNYMFLMLERRPVRSFKSR